MNIAIIIGVSKYNTQPDIPAVANDAAAIETIIRQSAKYDDILYLNEEVKSEKAKSSLASFVEKHNGKDVDSVFFYYSGHGDFNGQDFFYIFSNFEQKQYRASTISNNEIDILLKSMKPKLTVKVIDACHAGISYVKDMDLFEKHINRTAEGFNRCYFLFSCQSSQTSFADGKMSFFTSSLLSSLNDFEGEAIRYKDIIDYISDSFASDGQQTPFFVTQATFTEYLFDNLSEIKKYIATYIASPGGSIKAFGESDLKNRIAENLKHYCSHDQALETVGRVEGIVFSYKAPEQVAEYYGVVATKITDNSAVPNAREIGSWIYTNVKSNNYFAKPTYKVERRKRVKDRLSSWLGFSPLRASGVGSRNTGDEIEEYDEYVVSGFETKLPKEFNGYSVGLRAEVDNLPDFSLYVVPIFSKRKLAMFYAMTMSIDSSWHEKRINPVFDWQLFVNDAVKIEEIISSTKLLLSSFDDYIIAAIEDILSRESADMPDDKEVSPSAVLPESKD